MNLSLFEHAARLLKKDFPSSSDAKQSPVDEGEMLWFLQSRESRRAFLLGCVTFRSLWTAAVEVSSYSWGNVARCQSPLSVLFPPLLGFICSSCLFLLFSQQRADPACADASSILICSLNVLNPFIPILNVTLCIYCRWAVEQIVES